jgi:hypothetical protein
MYKISIALILLALAFGTSAKEAGPPKDLANRAATLDAQSRSALGVGILALSLLDNTGPNLHFPKEMLSQIGTWSRYQELERAGYVTLTESTGLPDGSAPGTQFVAIVLTAKGQQLRDALRKP